MEKKINIAELLKNCQRGMELDCTIYDDVTLNGVTFESDCHYDSKNNYPIEIVTKNGFRTRLTKYGQNVDINEAKCVIFPKGKTTWEGFVAPCKFKGGDVLISESGNIVLLSHIDTQNIVHYHCIIPTYGSFRVEENTSVGVGRYYECVLANEHQKQIMYDKIKCSGYKYNQNTNKLEKLITPKLKVGDKVKRKDVNYHFTVTIVKLDGDYYDYVNEDGQCGVIYISQQDDWVLVPNKFDLTTLKPFDKVLVRLTYNCVWMPKFFSHYDTDAKMKYYPYITTDNIGYSQCIPHEGNENLCRTTNDCDEYYKTWE